MIWAQIIGAVCGILALGIFLGLVKDLMLWVRKDAFQEGYQKGFADARKFSVSELWWNTAAHEVDEARQNIWKEEGEKKRWP
jgi:hypothetical protein